jgi:ferredoxin
MSANIEINLEECTGCKTCVEACFVDERPAWRIDGRSLSVTLHSRDNFFFCTFE